LHGLLEGAGINAMLKVRDVHDPDYW